MDWPLPDFRYAQYVVQHDGVRHRSPCVAGSSTRVIYPAHMVFEQGMTPGEVADQLSLPLASVYGALAFYLDNREEVEAEEAGREVWAEQYRLELERSRPTASA